jgi:Fe-S-cluster-containing hydrogenase component 2
MAVYVDKEQCTGCGICVSHCPVQAITLQNDHAVIDQEKCTECLRCMDECPVDAIYQVLDEKTPIPRQDSYPAVQNQTYSPPPAQQSGDRIQGAFSFGESLVRGITSVIKIFGNNDSSAGSRGTGMGGRGKSKGRGIQRRRRGGRK